MKKPKVVIVGAGPGGLTAGMLLAHKGLHVEIYEKNPEVGGRNGCLEMDGFKFDIGPTFLMLKPVLDEVFEQSGENVNDHLEFHDLDPMYHLVFKDVSLRMSRDHKKTREEIKKNFPGEEAGFDRLLKMEKRRFEAAFPCLQKDYSSFRKLFNRHLFNFLPRLSWPNSMFTELGKYFKSDTLKMAFTFQSKYLGMSPMECPAAYMIIPFIEHNFGIQHVKGGLSEISRAMAKVVLKKGGKIFTGTTVKKIGEKKIILADGKEVEADKIIVNADVGYAMKNLMHGKDFSRKKFSCSTFMLYLGLDTPLKLEHHTIFFSDDYKKFLHTVFRGKKLTDDFSMYVRNASLTDPTIAPAGKYNIYVLIPVPNNTSKIDWEKEKASFRDKVIKKIREKTGVDIGPHILTEHMITPAGWERSYNVFKGATFNLAHNIGQMLYLRPHNRLSRDLFLVGGGTHPGSGLPTIYESGRITANLILEDFHKGHH
jgi:phytoene desaturase